MDGSTIAIDALTHPNVRIALGVIVTTSRMR